MYRDGLCLFLWKNRWICDLDVMIVVLCVYCGCCEFVCAGGCGLGLYLYKFGHSCACDTRIIGL